MLSSNISHPMIWKLSHMVVPGKNLILSPEMLTTSRRTPFDMKFPSSGSSKRYDYSGGIGLGIVAALDKSSIGINPVWYSDTGSNGSDPIRYSRRFQFAAEIDYLSEEYTCVTSRRDGLIKVYYNDEEYEIGQNQLDGDRRWKASIDIAEESSQKKVLRDSPHFLTSCCLCKKKLQGKDIYMYKGDKGFCSIECRSVNIMEDDLNVKHKSTSVEVLSSPHAGEDISSAGIFVI